MRVSQRVTGQPWNHNHVRARMTYHARRTSAGIRRPRVVVIILYPSSQSGSLCLVYIRPPPISLRCWAFSRRPSDEGDEKQNNNKNVQFLWSIPLVFVRAPRFNRQSSSVNYIGTFHARYGLIFSENKLHYESMSRRILWNESTYLRFGRPSKSQKHNRKRIISKMSELQYKRKLNKRKYNYVQ